MAVEENEFFRNATLRICSSLEIEKALFDCFVYIAGHIPAGEAYLFHRENNSPSTLIYAHADHSGGRLMGQRFQLSPPARELIERAGFPGELIINRADDHALGKELLKILGKSKVSALYIRLVVEGTPLGSLTLLAEGWNRFNRDHLNLLKLLKQPAAIALANSRRYQELAEVKDLLADNNRFLQNELRSTFESEVVGADFGLRKAMNLVRQVASEDAPVLVRGETGVGKEVVATAIHNLSRRRLGPFIKLNCGSIPENLIDSELFGHEKGAFTGAFQQFRGRFERADGGTLFLDEIGELPLAAQVRLLRVLQEREIERVGGTRPVKVNVRLVIATHRDLWRMASEGKFREDLFYRINVFPIDIPPLRDRKIDIPALVQYFVTKKASAMGLSNIPGIAPGEIERLLDYPWPGNVRELENLVERSLILNRQGPISFGVLQAGPRSRPAMIADNAAQLVRLDALIANHIERALESTKGKVNGEGGAAQILGINPSTLRHRMRRHKIAFGRKTKNHSRSTLHAPAVETAG
jgi:transcriptional regulator with GAF, ATPase, and Fis domain